MKPVTTGRGVSGIFADELSMLICDLRTESRDQRWQMYIQVLHSPEYSLRVYAPDGHSEPYTITKTQNTAKELGEILVDEVKSWRSRARAAVALITDERPVSTG
jgi:hypothetical protein